MMIQKRKESNHILEPTLTFSLGEVWRCIIVGWILLLRFVLVLVLAGWLATCVGGQLGDMGSGHSFFFLLGGFEGESEGV